MVKILCYHRVSNINNDYNMINVSIKNFRSQMRWLSENYKMISLSEYDYYEKIEEKAVAVTFDDGYRDVIENALPILTEFNIPATLFITTGNLDTEYENWTDNIIRCIFEPFVYHSEFECHNEILDGKWDVSSLEKRVSFYRKMSLFFRQSNAEKKKIIEELLLEWSGHNKIGRMDRKIITKEQLEIVSNNPLISIGAHCVTHPSLGRLSLEEQKYEIRESIKELERITGKEIDTFAYPFGSVNDYSDITIELLENYGIVKAFTTQSVLFDNGGKTNLEIPRLVCANYDLYGFTKFIIGEFKKNNFQNKTSEKGQTNIYSGSIELDYDLFITKYKIVIWGCGFWGKSLYQDLKLCGISDQVIAFGDNDEAKIGGEIHGINIIDVEETLKLQKHGQIVVLVKNTCDYDIVNQLTKIGIKKIHIISRN